MKYLLDTNVVSEFTRGVPNPGVRAWLAAVDEADTALCVVTVGEIENGIAAMPPGKRRQRLSDWLEQSLLPRFGARLLPLELADLRLWGRLVGEGLRTGRPLPQVDALIAAVAINHGLTLVTRNAGDFQRMPVNICNPWLPEP